MANPDKDYRENPARAIYLVGKITQQTVHDLTPKILDLRNASTDPITVYIDSPGGSIAYAETIRSLIKAPDQDRKRRRLITVVTGTAGSAAADFFALGDYAISYPDAEIVYHGSRQSLDWEFTYEFASLLAASLQETNERFALRLARYSFPRICWRMIQLDAFEAYCSGCATLEKLIDSLKEKFKQPNRALLDEALKKQGLIRGLSTSVASHLKKVGDVDALSNSQFQAELLEAIVQYRTDSHRDDGWLLSTVGMQEVTHDFNLLYDFYYGSHAREIETLVGAYGFWFLLPEDREKIKALTGEERQKFLVEKTASTVQPLWYFVVSLCRLLQTKDYTFAAEEAYWVGVADEVPGSELLNDRELVESLPAPPTTTAPSEAKPSEEPKSPEAGGPPST
jgi:hypothetical protein